MFSMKRVLIFPSIYQTLTQHTNSLFLKKNLRFTSSSVQADYSGRTVKLAHQEFAVPSVSEKTVPIIILHGLLGSKTNWNSMAKALMRDTDNRMVITLDARNHGDSPHSDEFNYEIMVSDLLEFLNDKAIDRASFIGHSMGGRVCMLLALKYPELVQSLVVVDISPIGHSPSMLDLPKLFRTLKDLNLDPKLTVSEARKLATAQLKEKNLDDKLISFLMTNLVADQYSNWRWKFNLDSILKNFDSGIRQFPIFPAQYDKPTLFVAGKDSDYIREKDELDIKSLYPAAKFVYIAGAGHWVHAEKPQEFLSVVSQFLKP